MSTPWGVPVPQDRGPDTGAPMADLVFLLLTLALFVLLATIVRGVDRL